jgi:hypothetical protein
MQKLLQCYRITFTYILKETFINEGKSSKYIDQQMHFTKYNS